MKCTVYNYPAALLRSENVPTWECFIFLLENTPSTTIDTTTTLNFNSTTVQFSIKNWSPSFPLDLGSLINPNNTYLFFEVINYEIIQQTEMYITVKAEIKINVYLSFCVNYFTGDSVTTNDVFFIRKHVNRYLNSNEYTPSTWSKYGSFHQTPFYIDWKHQPWLFHLDDDLKDLKNEMQVWNYLKNTVWGENYTGRYASLNIQNLNNPNSLLESSINYSIPNYNNNPTTYQINSTPAHNLDTLYNQVLTGDSYYSNGTNTTNREQVINTVTQWGVYNHQLQYLYGVLNTAAGDFTGTIVNYFTQNYNNTNAALTTNINLLLPIFNTSISNCFVGVNYLNVEAGTNPINYYASLGCDIFSLVKGLSKSVLQDIVVLPFMWTEFITQQTLNPLVQAQMFVNQPDFQLISNPNITWQNICGLYLGSIFYVSHLQNTQVKGKGDDMHTYMQPNDNGNDISKMYISQIPFEPMTLNNNIYYWKVRFYNHEDLVDISNFENITFSDFIDYSSFLPYLFNFKILYNYPNTNITNLTYDELNRLSINQQTANDPQGLLNLKPTNQLIYNSYNAVTPYNGTTIISPLWNKEINNQLLFNIEWRNTIASESDNWANFQENNHNQYLLGRNLGILNIASNVLSMGASAAERNPLGVLGGAESLAGSIMNYDYKYNGGMKADYSRAPDLRAAGSLNALNNGLSVLIQENFLNPTAQKIVEQRYSLKGYIINRYLPFNYWWNRKYWNWVQIANFASVFGANVPSFIVEEINTLFNNGVRIISKDALKNNGSNYYIDWSLWNQNTEINNNNEEIIVINGDEVIKND